MNGGLSTFIAFVLLANSKSPVFITFFRVFLLVVVFGLFHGLALLPVILSWIGPPPNVEHSRPDKDSSGRRKSKRNLLGKNEQVVCEGRNIGKVWIFSLRATN